jgi:hypothetical protein
MQAMRRNGLLLMSNSGLNLYQDELLEILVEECAEITQEKSKIFRFGIDEQSHHIIGKSHRECLAQELGDMVCLIDMVISSNIGITYDEVHRAAGEKRKKLKKWMTNQKPNDTKNTLFKLWSKSNHKEKK